MKLNDSTKNKIYQNARVYEIPSSRIIFAERLEKLEDHLARYKLADIFLDTYPYNGHTTAGDALFSGIPVVSIHGSTFASRVAASLLNDIGLPELTCTDSDEYFNKALEIVTNKNYRDHLKNKLSQCKEKKIWPINSKIMAQNFISIIGGL
jgi:predicted O-linked N-acetylglucosamine transferase (SPINDLY family)